MEEKIMLFPIDKSFVRAFCAAAVLAALPGTMAQAAPPVPMHKTCAGPNDVTLDFVQADINDVLKALAMQTRVNIVSGNDVKGTITVSLAHVSLDEALQLISRLSGYEYAKAGRTYVVGSPASIAALTQSGTASAPPATAVLGYTYSTSTDLSETFKNLLPNLKVSTGKVAGNTGGGGVLVVTGTAADVEQAREIVTQAEAALSRNIAGSDTQLYLIKYMAPDDLVSVLTRLVPGLVVTPGPTQGFNLQAPVTADAGGTTSSTTSYGAATAGATTTTTGGNPPAHPTTPSLLLTGGTADIARARQILATVDVRPAQINYEAKVTEINLNNVKDFGLTYDFSGFSTTIGEEPPAYIPDPNTPGKFIAQPTPALDPYGGMIGKLRTFGRSFITNFVTVGLKAAITRGDAKLLSSPNISALDGQPAATFIGDNITYISSITNSASGQNVTTATASAGIKLFVTGKVNNDGYVTLNIHPEVSTLRLVPSLNGAQLPQISTREATTTLRVKDGETIALGGLIQQQDIKNIQGVPYLENLPFFGQLFRSTSVTHTRDEVVIFIKVTVQKDTA